MEELDHSSIKTVLLRPPIEHTLLPCKLREMRLLKLNIILKFMKEVVIE